MSSLAAFLFREGVFERSSVMSVPTLALAAGGGECPAISHVLKSQFAAAKARGWRVVGIENGFAGLLGRKPAYRELSDADFAHIDVEKGCVLGMSRQSLVDEPELVREALGNLTGPPINADYFAFDGGDDSRSSLDWLEEERKRQGKDLGLVHLPKSIDDDFPHEEGVSNCGADTAQEAMAELLDTYDADFSSGKNRLALVQTMGRDAGFLPLGAVQKLFQRLKEIAARRGKTALPPFFFIPEMVKKVTGGEKVPVDMIIDWLVMSARQTYLLAQDPQFLVPKIVVIAEGLFECLDKAGRDLFKDMMSRDEHGHTELAVIPFTPFLVNWVQTRLPRIRVPLKLRPCEVGYEVRVAFPNESDRRYAEALGEPVMEYFASGESGATVYMKGDRVHFRPSEEIPRADGRVVTREVNMDDPQFSTLMEKSMKVLRAGWTEAYRPI